MKQGEVSTAYFKNPITHGMIPFEHEVIVYDVGRAFGWSGSLVGGHHDRHVYEIIPTGDGKTLFRQTDGVYGKPSNVLSCLAEHGIEASYHSFNKALKARVESLKA